MKHALASLDARRARSSGFALITVLLVLLALLVLCAPFLMNARNAAKASTQLSDRAQVRLALDAAARHARAKLGGSHPAVDSTPYFDDYEELSELAPPDPKFLNAHDESGTMWDASISDVAAEIDLNSAPPQLIANLLGAATRTTAVLKPDATEISVSSTWGFAPSGYLWVGRELVKYAELESSKFTKVTRGVGSQKDADGNPLDCGPQPGGSQPINTLVIDQRAYAVALWRTITPDGELRELDAPEQVRDCAQLALGGLDEGAVGALLARGSTYAGVRAGRQWQRPVRLVNSVEAGTTCILDVDEKRWFNPGTTVQISDGRSTELGLVQEVLDRGIRLFDPLKNDYTAFTAEVRAQARRPVNVNLASVETLEALFTNLSVRTINERVTRDQARALAQLVVASRPFIGLEDFLRRAILPAAGLEQLPTDAPAQPEQLADGKTVIDTWDAVAVYLNALNANDSSLSYSTLPLSFTSRDVFDLNLRAVVNAPSGVERASVVRNQVELIVPQRDLLQLWARQEDWDEAFRFDLEAPLWSTGPNAVQQWDSGASPPSKFAPHFGTWGGQVYIPGVTKLPQGSASTEAPQAEHIFASREESGWAQLWASREPDDTGLANRHVVHFDHESRDPEGRYLRDETVVKLTSSNDVGWTSAQNTLLRATNFSFWFKPRDLQPGILLDVGRTSLETDRLTLGIESNANGNDLVLRVFDGGGDLSQTPNFKEAGEARYSLTPGLGPGLSQDTWSHCAIDVRGTRPSQITMLIDGRDIGVRKPGLTRLKGALPDSVTTISVESTDGFPSPCVLRIGQELIECKVTGPSTFDATPHLGPNDADAGFGGRLARVPFVIQQNGTDPGVPTALGVNTNHAANTPVELYGFASVLASNVPNGSATLPSDVGAFAVGIVTGVIGGQTPQGDTIQDANFLFPFGAGLDGTSSATALKLGVADPAMPLPTLYAAFNTTGGYAVLIQRIPGPWRNPLTNSTDTVFETAQGTPIFGVEIIKYSAATGGVLVIEQRNALPVINTTGQAGARAFVTDFEDVWMVDFGTSTQHPMDQDLERKVFIVPISIPANGASSISGFLGTANGSEFAQITHTGSNAEETEWVRYDQFVNGFLLRSEATAIARLTLALTHGNGGTVDGTFPPVGGGGGPPGGPPAMREPDANADESATTDAVLAVGAITAPPPNASAARQTTAGSLWQAYWGITSATATTELQWPVTRAARTAFQFRGVLGTYAHKHVSGTVVLPVWRVQRNGVDGGMPGRFDTVVLMEDAVSALGWPAEVHRTFQPVNHTESAWVPNPADWTTPAASQPTTAVPEDPVILARNAICVALKEPAAVPIPMTLTGATAAPIYETRQLARVLKHPSGERPREVDRVVVGGTIRGVEIANSIADELVYGSTPFGDGNGSPAQGGHLILTQDFQENAPTAVVATQSLRIAYGQWSTSHNFCADLPTDAGLLRISGEILAYDSVDTTNGTLGIPQEGRGLLGTTQTPHEIGETVEFLDQFVVSVLAAGVAPGDAALPLTDVAGFPFQGTVLIGDELIHYTRIAGAALEMPRLSKEAGLKDHKGDGLFRGRFGSTAQAHLKGTPVILFPFRYWDRWAERADAPELAYFSLAVDQPNAFWRGAFWNEQEASSGKVRVEVLQRVSSRGQDLIPWDSDPKTTRGLTLLTDGMPKGASNPIARQGDMIEWRAHVRYAPGAFDAQTGLSHGWKQTPRLRVFGVESMAPSMVLRRVDE